MWRLTSQHHHAYGHIYANQKSLSSGTVNVDQIFWRDVLLAPGRRHFLPASADGLANDLAGPGMRTDQPWCGI